MRRSVYLVLAVGVVGLIAFEVATAGKGGDTGKEAPPLPAAVLQGPKVSLADLRGHPALIDFWASWCEPCREEAPEVARLGRRPGSAKVVGVDYTDREDSARSFLERYGWTFPVLSDPDGIYGAHFGFSALPTAVVLDPRGRVSAILRGPQSVSDFRAALRQAQ